MPQRAISPEPYTVKRKVQRHQTNEMKIVRIMPGMGIRSNVGSMGACAVTMLEDAGERILVDVGHFGSRAALLVALKERKLTPKDFDIVVLTHIHWDHCLNIDLFENAKILLGKDELKIGTLNDKDDPHSRHFRKFLNEMGAVGVSESYKVSDNTSIVETEGHSPGHVALLAKDKEELVIVSGDAIPGLRAFRRGIPDFVFYDLEKAKRSIAKLKKLEPSKIIPGHDRPFNDSGYLENDDLEFIFRKEKEENFLLRLRNVGADEPQIV
jgi:glyoxylase-like metal-dependent hydrolase (beta-lactamase superfamily II)